jgi:hypothetical protein
VRPSRRRTATRVRDGRVQKKNNWAPDRGDYFARSQDEIRLDRRHPGPGGRHVVTISQLRRFLALLPDWDDIAIGLDAIVLDEWRSDAMGWYDDGVVALCAWPAHSGFWHEADKPWIDANAPLLDRLEVQTDEIDGRFGLLWTEAQARAFMLLDVLPHELGHHRDLMTTRSRRDAARGEPYAVAYARDVLDAVWPAYVREFGV